MLLLLLILPSASKSSTDVFPTSVGHSFSGSSSSISTISIAVCQGSNLYPLYSALSLDNLIHRKGLLVPLKCEWSQTRELQTCSLNHLLSIFIWVSRCAQFALNWNHHFPQRFPPPLFSILLTYILIHPVFQAWNPGPILTFIPTTSNIIWWISKWIHAGKFPNARAFILMYTASLRTIHDIYFLTGLSKFFISHFMPSTCKWAHSIFTTLITRYYFSYYISEEIEAQKGLRQPPEGHI